MGKALTPKDNTMQDSTQERMYVITNATVKHTHNAPEEELIKKRNTTVNHIEDSPEEALLCKKLHEMARNMHGPLEEVEFLRSNTPVGRMGDSSGATLTIRCIGQRRLAL